MKIRLSVFLCLIAALLGLVLLSQTALGYTYPKPPDTTSAPGMRFIILFVLPTIGLSIVSLFAWEANRANRLEKSGSPMMIEVRVKFPKALEDKLLPGEKAIAHVAIGGSGFVATDRRLLRCSARECEALDYTEMSGISYIVPRGRRLASRVTMGFCAVALIFIAGGVWGAFFDPSVTGVSIYEPIAVSLFCFSIAAVSIWGMRAFDFGYYQIESRTADNPVMKGWQLQRGHFARASVDWFVKTINERITSSAEPA